MLAKIEDCSIFLRCMQLSGWSSFLGKASAKQEMNGGTIENMVTKPRFSFFSMKDTIFSILLSSDMKSN